MKSPKSKEKRNKTPSPIKVKDFFTNPLHKIKQPAFTQIGFTSGTLNTFVKSFTYRENSNYINMSAIKSYIKSFTNNNPKLMHLYEQFFNRNFKQKQNGLIELDHFMQFFVHQQKKEDISIKNLIELFEDMEPLNSKKLLQKSEYLGVSMTQIQAQKIVKMVNRHYGNHKEQYITKQMFIKAINQEIYD